MWKHSGQEGSSPDRQIACLDVTKPGDLPFFNFYIIPIFSEITSYFTLREYENLIWPKTSHSLCI